jgi:hypothetical protein
MSTLVARLRYLRAGEVRAALILPIVFIYSWHGDANPIAWELRIPALLLLSYLLAQGAYYWHLKLRSVTERTRLPVYFLTLFQTLKWSNYLAMGAFLVVLVVQARAGVAAADIQWSAGLLALAMAEQVNYYSYQLMYDTAQTVRYLRRHRRLRKAALAIDLARHR